MIAGEQPVTATKAKHAANTALTGISLPDTDRLGQLSLGAPCVMSATEGRVAEPPLLPADATIVKSPAS